MKNTIQSIVLLLVAILFSNCAFNPVKGKKEFSLMSEKKEQQMGDQSHPSIMATYGAYEDKKMQEFITAKGTQMARVSHRPDLKYTFNVVDSPVVNAFALPGGYVYFTRGIMAHFNNEAEFAGVLGHEIGHVTARHSAQQYSKQMLGQVLFIGGLIASPQFRQYANEASQGMQLMFLKFGRDHESQSDQLGVEYSTKIGYDSHYMADFFQTINRLQTKAGVDIPDFMSTHPNPVDRYKNVHQMTDEMQGNMTTKNFKVNRERYLQMIDGIVYGDDPKQGFVENDMFYHPVLKFQFPVPSRWKHQNSPAQFQMAPQDGKAMMQLSLAQGNTLEEAGSAFVEKHKLTIVNSQKIKVNGLPTLAFVAEQAAQQQGQAGMRLLVYIIEYNGLKYMLLGASSTQDYRNYERTFKSVMDNFDILTDQDKLNRQPDRINIEKVAKGGTLKSVLQGYNMPSKQLEELAILNGMKLTDQVKAGSLIKTIGK